MKYRLFEHRSGKRKVPAKIRNEVGFAIYGVAIKAARGKAAALRERLLSNLKTQGWPGEVRVSPESDITITSLKRRVGLCIQTGNVARLYADLIKLQTLFLNGAIGAAVVIVPSAEMAKVLGSNLAQFERLQRELRIFDKAYSAPTIIFALE